MTTFIDFLKETDQSSRIQEFKTMLNELDKLQDEASMIETIKNAFCYIAIFCKVLNITIEDLFIKFDDEYYSFHTPDEMEMLQSIKEDANELGNKIDDNFFEILTKLVGCLRAFIHFKGLEFKNNFIVAITTIKGEFGETLKKHIINY